MSENIEITFGTYKIAVWTPKVGPETLFLTALEGNKVTVAPEIPEQALAQQWSVSSGSNETFVIRNPPDLFPTNSLSYRNPEVGERIFLVLDPVCEWRIKPAPQKAFLNAYFIQVPEHDLMMVVSPLAVHPPQVVLDYDSVEIEKAWALIPVLEH